MAGMPCALAVTVVSMGLTAHLSGIAQTATPGLAQAVQGTRPPPQPAGGSSGPTDAEARAAFDRALRERMLDAALGSAGLGSVGRSSVGLSSGGLGSAGLAAGSVRADRRRLAS